MRCLELDFFVRLKPFWLKLSVSRFCFVCALLCAKQRQMGRSRKWVLEDNLQEAVWRTIMRGPRPPSERWEKRNKSDVSRISKAPKVVLRKPQEKVQVSVPRKLGMQVSAPNLCLQIRFSRQPVPESSISSEFSRRLARRTTCILPSSKPSRRQSPKHGNDL